LIRSAVVGLPGHQIFVLYTLIYKDEGAKYLNPKKLLGYEILFRAYSETFFKKTFYNTF